MANRDFPTGSSTTTQMEFPISVRTDQGVIPLKYSNDDTILDLKRQLEASYGYLVQIQQFTFSGGVPGDPVQAAGDTALIRDFVGRPGTLRLELAQTNMPGHIAAEADGGPSGEVAGPQHATTNKLGDVRTTDSGIAMAGNYHSETALAAGSGKLVGAINEVEKASVAGQARLIVGDRFGGADPLEMLLHKV